MCLRIQLSRATVKELHSRLQHAYQRDDVRLVRRITVLLDLLAHQVPVDVLSERWGLSPSCLYHWRQAFLLRGMDSLAYHHSGGRRPKLTSRQKKRLVELLEAGPQVVGCETACWTSVLIRVLIGREFGVLDNCQYVCTLLTTWAVHFKRRGLSPTISTRPGGTLGSRRNGPGSCVPPSDSTALSSWRMKPVLPSGGR